MYSQYRPAKLREGADHPDPIVESQSLAGVMPPDPTYAHHLHKEVKKVCVRGSVMQSVDTECGIEWRAEM